MSKRVQGVVAVGLMAMAMPMMASQMGAAEVGGPVVAAAAPVVVPVAVVAPVAVATPVAVAAPVHEAVAVAAPVVVRVSASGGAGESQVKDDLFAGTEKFAANASDVSDVNLDSKMMGMMGKDKSGVANKMDFVVVHSYTYDKPGMYKLEDVEEYTKKLQGGAWNCFVHTRERKSGESTDICSKTNSDSSNELVIVTAEPKELTFVHIKGRMSLSDLQNWNKGDKGGK